MPRTAVPITAMSSAGTSNQPTATAIDATNNHVFTPDRSFDQLMIVLLNTFAGSKAVTIKAGVNPPAKRKDLGDLTITLAAQNDRAYQVLEGARFVQADGTVNIDVAASMTGSIWVLGIPKGF